MAKISRNNLKTYFQTGERPTEDQFIDLIDSSVNNFEDKANLTETEAGTNDIKYITPKTAKRSVEKFASSGVPAATISTQGKVKLATLTEVQNGINTENAVTPEGAKRASELHAPVQSVNGQTGDIVLDLGGGDSGWEYPILLSGIQNYNPGFFQVARYRKKNGVVYIEGLVKEGNATGNVTIFNLPVGFRPEKRLVLSSSRSSSNVSRTDVYPNGDVICYNYSLSYTSISGISFLVD